ncbi:MAG: putative acetyltransferase [Actinomycetota bacterium]
MALDVSIGGRDYRVRKPLGVFALSVVTIGMYWLYWYYRVNDDIRMYLRNYSIRPFVSTLAIAGLFLAAPLVVVAIFADQWWVLAVAALLVVMALVGFFHTGRRVITAQEQAGVDPSSAGLALLLYMVAGFLGGSYLQAGLNRAWTKAAGEEGERLAAASAATPEHELVKPFPRPAPKAGTNLVSPDDLGSRVTFQFELPNGYTTEAVGVFERWDPAAETYFVRKKDGTEVRVPARGVRYGKVIPDRPAAPTPG